MKVAIEGDDRESLLFGELPYCPVIGAGKSDIAHGARFNQATIDLLDRNQKLFSPSEVLRLAIILKLDV